MKRSIIILISSAIAIAFGACNKHSWDEEIDGRIPTKEIFQPHGEHEKGAAHPDPAHPEKEGEAPKHP